MKKILVFIIIPFFIISCSKPTISNDQIIADMIGDKIGNYKFTSLNEIVDTKIKLKNENDNIREYEVLLIAQDDKTKRYSFHQILSTYILKGDLFEVKQKKVINQFNDFQFKKIENISAKSKNESWTGKIKFGRTTKNMILVINNPSSKEKTGYVIIGNEMLDVNLATKSVYNEKTKKSEWKTYGLYKLETFSDNYQSMFFDSDLIVDEAASYYGLQGKLTTDRADKYCCGNYNLKQTNDLYDVFFKKETSILE